MSQKHLSPEQCAEALRQADGDRKAAAKILGCSQTTVDKAVRRLAEITALCAPYIRLPGDRRRYRPEQVAEALRQAGGSRTQAAKLLGCRKETVTAYIKHYPEVRATLDARPPSLKSPDQIVDALRQAGGDKRRAAQLLGVSRATLYQYVHRYPAVREECAALDQVRRDRRLQCAARGQPERFGPEKVSEALRLTGGIKSHAATLLGCTRQTVGNYIKRYPEVHEVWIEARETIVDAAQSKLYEAVERGEWPAVHFTLSTLGKDRGFTTRPVPLPWEISEQERRRAQILADIEKVYGEAEED